ncbi:LacI family DNA-binding transcriptional regulator [Bordetella sp. BOR01]|uniref:LacI family DNA-binding transcriptional regulator n=1 Tax=Bordetella sp. BOR01 TaxID=2854779 RepID=UPI001C43F61C|nr:LacI family DNA-binding transcriptional regulator [Bordetella sp. BOR01]MBV7483393.1 LacI family transcriptional regulator [Bordetella sp. BOR01]
MATKNKSSVGLNRDAGANVTIKDIANSLGLAYSTVSRALADHPKISSDTRARVHEAARAMGYVPNGPARNMKNMQSPVVGLLIPDIQNSFYASIAKIVGDAAMERGLQLALSVTEDNPARELQDLRAFVVSRAAGIIITPTATPKPETLALLAGMRAAQLVRCHPEIEKEAVVIDDASAIRTAAVHLINYGHRRIGYVGTTTDFSCGVDRLSGFTAALQANGLNQDFISVGLPRPEFAHHAVHAMMSRADRPTGLVIGSSSLTIGALKALRSLGLSAPADVSLVGYGDPEWFDLVGDGLTTVSLPVQAMGTYAISSLLAQIDGHVQFSGSTASASRFPASLTVRGSTRPWRE